jgi:integrase
LASIHKRITGKGRVRYRAQVRVKGYPNQSATFLKKSEAVLWSQQKEAELKLGKTSPDPLPLPEHTLTNLIDRYIQEVLPQKKDQCPLRLLWWWKAQIGDYNLDQVSPPLIIECRTKLARGKTFKGTKRSPSTVNRYLAILSHAFTIAWKEWQWIDQNPVAQIRKLKEPRGRVRFLDDEERGRLLDACKVNRNPYLYTIVVLALSTGMRKGEILGPRRRDVDLAKKRIILHETKNGERRVVPLVGPALEQVKRILERSCQTSESFVFHNHGYPDKSICIRTAWVNTVKKARVEDFTFHDLRHSAASYLAMSGASLIEIADILGHKSLEMVKRYAHLSEEHSASVVEKMNQKIFS